MARALVAVFALAIILVAGATGLQASLEEAGSNEVVINETFTPGSGGVVQLDDSEKTGAYYDNETTVYNASDTQMVEGTDYNWIEANGTIDVLTGGDLAGDSEGKISYSYQLTTEEQREWARVMGALSRGLGLAFPAFLLVVLLLLVKG